MRKYLIVAVFVMLLGGCANIKAVGAMMRSTDHFIALKSNPSIRYEAGAEEYANLISEYLDKSVQVIKDRQGDFADGVMVFVPNTIESFVKYCAGPVRACVMGDRVFVSPKLMNQKKNILKLLIHELSHLQFKQYVGLWNYQLHVPGWFGEGLATYVSDGGGAERISKEQARKAILSGNLIEPTGSGGLLFSRSGIGSITDGQMFYRQSAMYVEWLYTQRPDDFHSLIELLRKGKTLDEAMFEVYGYKVKAGWGKFINEIKA